MLEVMHMTGLILENVEKHYGSACAVKDVNLHLPEGKLVCFLGPSGCGKTTLLRMIAGLETLSGGEIRLDGELLSGLSPRQRALRCAYLGQGDQSSWPLRLRDYVTLGRLPHRGNWGLGQRLRDEDQTAIDQALEQMRLDELAQRRFDQLSGGERARLAPSTGSRPSPRNMAIHAASGVGSSSPAGASGPASRSATRAVWVSVG